MLERGKKATGLRVIDWVREAEERGAGEIVPARTSMDADQWEWVRL